MDIVQKTVGFLFMFNAFTNFRSLTLPWTTWILTISSHYILSRVRIFLSLMRVACPTHLVNVLYMPVSVPNPMLFLLCLCRADESFQVWGRNEVYDKLERNAAKTPRYFPITLH